VHLGDSITAGQWIDPARRWTSHVENELARVSHATIVSHNRGLSGEQTRMALERFPDAVQAARPDILTIQYGMNDCNCWVTDAGVPRVSEAAFAANLAEMVGRARRHGTAHVILATNNPTLRPGVMISGERYEDANARYSEIVREVAAETDATLCDIREAFERSHLGLASLVLPEPDLLHLSEAGHRLYFETMWPLLESAVLEIVGTATRSPV
jgi:acyl-CoA thioesterase-1